VTRALAILAAVFVAIGAAPAFGQGDLVNGHVSFMLDALPDPDARPGRQPTTEIRTRLFAERRDEFGSHLRLVVSGHVDGLLVRVRAGADAAHDVIVRPLDLYADLVWPRVEVRVGASRIVWGRLDEFQPTDVVNPLDLSRFLLEGRTEARMAVGLVRGRVFLPGSATLDIIGVPGFRAGRFDQLDEPTSPFNLNLVPPALVDRRSPSFGADSLQGGGRLTATTGRVDWGATVYRGLRSFPTLTVRPEALTETFPRFTMVGGDFETVRGQWGVRGEAAFFVDDELQSLQPARGVEGQSIEAGIGVDRRAGSYRLAGNVLVARRTAGEEGLEESDVTLVVAADRSFARETRTLRLFAVYDPTEGTTFTRCIGAVSLRDDVWLEASGGLLTGTSTTSLGRLSRRDFLYARLKVYF
jgi:hypothetical protein